MRIVLGHAAVGEDAFQLLVSAAGGLHNTLALIATGVVAMQPRPAAAIRYVVRFTAVVLLGLTVGSVAPSLVAISVLGSVVAAAMGLVLVRREGAPAWLLQAAVGFFGFVYGVVQYVHFTEGGHASWGVWDVASTVVATVGAWGVGGFAAWANGGVPTGRSGPLLAAGVVVAAGLSWFSLGR